MDKRSWPWKKKIADKANADKLIAISESAGATTASSANQSDPGKQDKKPKYVQISVESYTHLSGLEDQVKLYEGEVKAYQDRVSSYEDQVKNLENIFNELNEKLSEADLEMITKENLVKQHAKVAEDDVSGWEKDEAEDLALKDRLESVTLLKLTAEDRASQCVVSTWSKQFNNAEKVQKGPLMYLANDILQNSKRKGNEFVTEFWKVLPAAINGLTEKGDDYGKNVASLYKKSVKKLSRQ